jgi:O-antigen/teichoic acid export membrane protein
MWAFIWATVALSVVVVIPLIVTVGWLVRFLFGQEFSEAVLIARILLAGMVFASARRVLSDGLKGRGYPAAGTLAEVAAGLWLALALGAMVPLWGAQGAAIALSSSYVVSLVALLILAARRGEARLAAVFGGPPLTAWNRLRFLALSKVS